MNDVTRYNKTNGKRSNTEMIYCLIKLLICYFILGGFKKK